MHYTARVHFQQDSQRAVEKCLTTPAQNLFEDRVVVIFVDPCLPVCVHGRQQMVGIENELQVCLVNHLSMSIHGFLNHKSEDVLANWERRNRKHGLLCNLCPKFKSDHGKHHRYIAPRLELQQLDVYFAMEEATTPKRYWLLKAEPDSRVVKGKDVKVSELGRRVPLADLVNS